MPKGFFDLDEISITRSDETIKPKKVIELSKEQLELYTHYKDQVIITTDVKKAIHLIKIISKSNMIAFDYETTGKKAI